MLLRRTLKMALRGIARMNALTARRRVSKDMAVARLAYDDAYDAVLDGAAVEEKSDGGRSVSRFDIWHFVFRDDLPSPRSRAVSLKLAAVLLPDPLSHPLSSPPSSAPPSLSPPPRRRRTTSRTSRPYDAPGRSVHHPNAALPRRGLSLTTGVGWSDYDEDMLSSRTRRFSAANRSQARSAPVPGKRGADARPLAPARVVHPAIHHESSLPAV